MTIERAFPQGWGVGDKLSSAQINQIDENAAAGIDGRAGQIDYFMSSVVATGTGRILATVATGPDANKTFYVDGGNSIVRVPTLTAARSYTLGLSGASGGDRILFSIEGTGIGLSPSGYVDVKNHQGTGLFRLGLVNVGSPQSSAEGSEAEFMFNGSSWQLLRGAGPGLRTIEFTSSTTWVCPPGVHQVVVQGWGGGGGGAAGGELGGSSVVQGHAGGGGGGGALPGRALVSVIPGRSYDIAIGAGGSGSTAFTSEARDGGDTTFSLGGVALATFRGAAGGGVATAALLNVSPTGMFAISPGGANIRSPSGFALVNKRVGRVGSGSDLRFGGFGPGWGGNGISVNVPTLSAFTHGFPSVEGYEGGACGGFAPSGTAYRPGGGGGGGGAGPGGAGGRGGDGATGVAAVTNGMSGLAGIAAAANSGAGGGGGGGASQGDPDSGTAGPGGAGGSGKLTIIIVK